MMTKKRKKKNKNKKEMNHVFTSPSPSYLGD